MANKSLSRLVFEATSLPLSQGPWLLEASTLSEAISSAVLSDPHELDRIQRAVRETANRAGCDLIVGASPAAEQVVSDLNTHGTEPSKALLFELVRVTGANLARAQWQLQDIEVVPAVFVDINPSSSSSGVLAVGSIET